ncbi:translation machinery-associated protein 16 [Dimargaris cristalligena]|uniref:Translation machinery-associated protein 16 n=1 Tax=Dimargaris cristalligena TaxID=215637 RepID=A0A4P9ZSI8_9FUNG|nr:translation machinery-associated protein 16 [Dimargaris cristalligena]RKP36536.1 hypothetical protein BJ085DRAFT_39058 [Dimargaris cristalligena]|eukprot:RKP36536.1 hypothetical protein BJ085DRAFT_39058 [Dimargaris cristalligena]
MPLVVRNRTLIQHSLTNTFVPDRRARYSSRLTTMPNNKKKSLKNIKGKETAHPYSRKARQIQRSLLRHDKFVEGRSSRLGLQNKSSERYLWFRYAMDDAKKSLSKAEVHELVQMYIERNDGEIEKLLSERRKGQPMPKNIEVLKMIKKSTDDEYRSGLKLPDLTHIATVEYLRDWNGDMNGIANMKFIIMTKPKPTTADSAPSSTSAIPGTDGTDTVMAVV